MNSVYAQDLESIRNNIPVLVHESDDTIISLYREFGEEWMCAGWPRINQYTLSQFSQWLNESPLKRIKRQQQKD